MEDVTTKQSWTVGELADEFELTVRTLHHWEHVGLLTPGRSEGGRRMYGPAEVDRVIAIGILRELGMPLEHIRVALDEPAGIDAKTFASERIQQLTAQIDQLMEQRSSLVALRAALGDGSSAREVAAAIRGIGMAFAQLTPDQMSRIEAVNARLADDQLLDLQQRGMAILDELKQLHRDGVAPDAAAAVDAARRSRELLVETVGGDVELALVLERMSLQPGFGDGFAGELTEAERAWLVDAVAHL